MNAAQLRTDLEVLSHHDRTRRMIALGRLPEAEREPILDDLAGGVYERRLVLASTYGSHDVQRTLEAALDPSVHVHGPAARQAARLCSDEQLTHLL